MLDDTAATILRLLQQDGRISTAEIARRIGLAQSAVHERIRKLERQGVIRGYTARIDPVAVAAGTIAFVLVRTLGYGQAAEVGGALAELPEVQEVHHVAGEDGLLLKVRVADTAALWDLLRDRLPQVGVERTRTTIVLETIKESGEVPLKEA